VLGGFFHFNAGFALLPGRPVSKRKRRNHQHTDSTPAQVHLPCESCGSSDALAVYDDGHTYCFSCQQRERGNEVSGIPLEVAAPSSIPAGVAGAVTSRGLHQETCEKWGYLQGNHHGKPCQIATYRDPETRQVVAAKIRYPGKEFEFAGDAKRAPLYGQWLWGSGGKMLTITEGEIDALSVSQAQDNKWPVVSVPNGAAGAVKAVEKAFEWVSSFDRVNIWFDNDEPGIKAARAVADILPPGKAHIVRSELKDANEYTKAGRVSDLVNAIWRAEPHRPDGIVAGSEIALESLREALVVGYGLPYGQLSSMLHGLRKRELTLLTAGSGIGKSTLAREIAYHLHQEHRQTIGNVYLEESKEKTAQGYIAIHNDVPLGNLRENPNLLAPEVWESSMAEVIHQRQFFYDHFGSLDSDNLLSKLRYLAVGCKCDFIILDHISIVVSGQEGSGEGERKDIDILMTNLRSLVENTGVGVIGIVHLSKPPGISHEEGGRVTLSHLRGSGSLKQLPDTIVALERDQQGDNSDESLIRVLKNREFGEVGEADTVVYDRETGRLKVSLGETVSEDDEDAPF
jgi:twinkle protein